MKIIKLSDEYYCVVKKCFYVDKFTNRATKVLKLREGSFAELYSKKILRSFFQYARDLKSEYQNYYLHEYGNFNEFLFRKELLDYRDIESLEINDGETLLALNTSFGECETQTLLEYETTGLDCGSTGLEYWNRVLEEVSA